jgi:hypothetical protein
MIYEIAAMALLGMAGLALLVVLVRREDSRLRRASRRYRELEWEGIEELRSPDDAYPEEALAGRWLREPDGRLADADRVLHEELNRAREHTRRQRMRRPRRSPLGKEASCLL